ncbi:hypothetical protein ACOTF1_28685, partial [Achromobacter ruhlandii]
TLATRQADALKEHAHTVSALDQIDGAGGAISRKADNRGSTTTGGIVGGGRTETRPANVAFHPRIHA